MPKFFGNPLAVDFPEYPPLFRVALGFFILVFIVVLGIFTQFPDEHPANVFTIITGLTIFAFVIEAATKGKLIKTQFVGLPQRALVATIAGTVFGFFLIAPGFSILGTPSPFSTTPFGLVEVFNFLYVIVLASIGETLFFQGFLFPTLGNLFQNPVIGLVLANAAFASYHVIAYGLDISLVFGAFLFGVIANIGSNVFGSQLFGVTAHFINNFTLLG